MNSPSLYCLSLALVAPPAGYLSSTIFLSPCHYRLEFCLCIGWTQLGVQYEALQTSWWAVTRFVAGHLDVALHHVFEFVLRKEPHDTQRSFIRFVSLQRLSRCILTKLMNPLWSTSYVSKSCQYSPFDASRNPRARIARSNSETSTSPDLSVSKVLKACACARAHSRVRGLVSRTRPWWGLHAADHSSQRVSVCSKCDTARTQYLPDGEVQRWSGQTLEIGSNGLATRIKHGLT